MYIFAKENMKYPVVCTENSTHWIVVGCSDEQLQQFETEHNLVRKDEGIFVVHHSDREDYFQMACASLPQRLNPIFADHQMPYENFFSMHKYFYKDNKHNLAVKGVLYSKEDATDCPFVKLTDEQLKNYICLKDVKLNG